MIKISFNDGNDEVTKTFSTNREMFNFVSDFAGSRRFKFRKRSYDNGQVVEMTYLTFYRGRLSETYTTTH